jgi:hypothetical protein
MSRGHNHASFIRQEVHASRAEIDSRCGVLFFESLQEGFPSLRWVGFQTLGGLLFEQVKGKFLGTQQRIESWIF